MVEVDIVHTESDAVRKLVEVSYAVVIIDRKAPVGDIAPALDGRRIVAETASAQPDAFIVLMTQEHEEARSLEGEQPGRVFRFLAGPDQRWQLSGIVWEGLRLQKLEREQRELIK